MRNCRLCLRFLCMLAKIQNPRDASVWMNPGSLVNYLCIYLNQNERITKEKRSTQMVPGEAVTTWVDKISFQKAWSDEYSHDQNKHKNKIGTLKRGWSLAILWWLVMHVGCSLALLTYPLAVRTAGIMGTRTPLTQRRAKVACDSPQRLSLMPP